MSSIETDLKPTFEEESRRRAERNDDERHEAATIERDIDATRADVRATLAALERRLSFDRLVEMTVGRIRERGGEFAGNLTDTATQNPVPVLLTSIGLGWMMLMSRRGAGNGSDRQPSRMRARAAEAMDGVGERFNEASERVHQAGSRLHDAVDSSRETLGETAESMRASASRAAAATREQVDYARERMDRLLHEQPLMLGALVAADYGSRRPLDRRCPRQGRQERGSDQPNGLRSGEGTCCVVFGARWPRRRGRASIAPALTLLGAQLLGVARRPDQPQRWRQELQLLSQ
jgi:hypothetical protein